MKHLLITTAVIEIGAGAALGVAPSALASILLGAPLESPVAIAVARIAGTALLSLGVACWMARHDAGSRAARGIIAGMLLYNFGAVAVLVYAATGVGLSGIGTWPAAVLHTALAVWCIACMAPRHNTPHDPIAPKRETTSRNHPREK